MYIYIHFIYIYTEVKKIIKLNINYTSSFISILILNIFNLYWIPKKTFIILSILKKINFLWVN